MHVLSGSHALAIALLLGAASVCCGHAGGESPAGGTGGSTAIADTEAETEADTEAEADTETETETEAEADTEPEPEPEPDTDTDTDTDRGSNASADGTPLPDLTGWIVGTGHEGVHTLAWRPKGGGKVPRNVEFVAEVLLLRDSRPVPGVTLQVTGFMPAHQHGLVQTPLVEELGAGRYAVSGLLLHMRGSWQLRFQVYAGPTTESFTFELEL